MEMNGGKPHAHYPNWMSPANSGLDALVLSDDLA